MNFFEEIMLQKMSLWEAMMLICFGASWPVSLSKTLKTKNVAGKSRMFMILILLGYISGMINKIQNWGIDLVFWLYVLNFAMVLADFLLVCKYRKLQKD